MYLLRWEKVDRRCFTEAGGQEEEPGQGAQVYGRGLEVDRKVYGGEEEPCFAFFLKKEFVGK